MSEIGSRIGRYFNLTSFVPSTLTVVYIDAIAQGRTRAGFDPHAAVEAVGSLGVTGWSLALGISLLVALLLHPLLYPLTQLLEGYWGTSRAAVWLAAVRCRAHQDAARTLDQRSFAARDRWIARSFHALPAGERRQLRHLRDTSPSLREHIAQDVLNTPRGRRFVADYLEEQACSRARTAYPATIHRILPTRLGNALRRHEDKTGSQYGLDAITIAPHLRLVADPAHYAYVEDEGDQLDLALRVCILGVASSAATLALLLPTGIWAALAVAPYAIAYLAYRAAVVSASAYATAVATVIDLDRFQLYDRLNLARPRSLAAEVKRGQDLMRVLNGEPLPPKRRVRFIRHSSS